MKLKKTLITGASVVAGVGAIIGALKIKKFLTRDEILIKESDLFTHIDLKNSEVPEKVLDAIKNKDFETFSIIVDKSAFDKLKEFDIDPNYTSPTWNDDLVEKFYIYDSSNLTSNEEDDIVDDTNDFVDLEDHTNDDVTPIV